MPGTEIRRAEPSEHQAIGYLTASTYLAEGFAGPDYAETLRDVAARAPHSTILVALTDGQLSGSVTVVTAGGPYAESTPPGTAVLRMLVTDPAFRGAGVGTALVQAAIAESRAAGCTMLRLSTGPGMTAAHRLYASLGFRRVPEQDWSPEPGVELMVCELPLVYCPHCGDPGNHAACRTDLDPPRYCAHCGRRMTVQVHPTGWTARCVEHGITQG